jgi:hypothetical protein
MTSIVLAPGLAAVCAMALAVHPAAQVPIGDPEDDEGGIGYDDDEDEDEDDDGDVEDDDDA